MGESLVFGLSCLQCVRSLGLFVVPRHARTMQRSGTLAGNGLAGSCAEFRVQNNGSSNERRHPSVKFRVERDVLAEAVTWTARSLSPRPPVPVLSGLLLKAEAGTVSLSSFDYETSARLEIPADISDRRHHPGFRPPPRRHLPQPAVGTGRYRNRRQQSHAHLPPKQLPPGHHARSRIPAAARRCPPSAAPLPATPSPRPSPR